MVGPFSPLAHRQVSHDSLCGTDSVCHWNRLAYYRGALVGAISCRVEATTSSSSSSDETNNVHRVYVDIAIGIAPVDSQPKRGQPSVGSQPSLRCLRSGDVGSVQS
jgi:hypothetical protein